MSGVILGSNSLTVDGKIIETCKSVGNIDRREAFPVVGNNVFQEPIIHFFPDVLPYVAPINIAGTGFAYVALVNTGATQTSYTINFQENTECDILVVGGGGGGGAGTGSSNEGGGGGAGGVVYMVNKTFNTGTYTINVGSGGTSNNNGNNSSITTNTNANILIDGINLIGQGGGGGATTSVTVGKDGGSGGGGCNSQTNGGTATQGNTFWNGTVYIAGGHSGEKPINFSRGGGGGGSVEIGGTDGQGAGGDGRSVSITGTSTFYAGGGGGVIPGGSASYSRSDGGGGIPNTSINNGSPTTGIANTGSGGGGSHSGGSPGASGGSGIVIIRFRTTPVIPIPASIISTIDSNYKYAFFANAGGNQTLYNIDFKQPTECDVLIVGGGGGGGMDMGGGGGAGGFIKLNNQSFNGLYTINVGKGGDGAPAARTNGQPAVHQFTINAKNGGNSQFGNNIAIGGGFGGSSYFTSSLGGQGSAGGSGGGSSGYSATNNINKAGVGTIGQGNRGGFGLQSHHSGGGGGAGSIGGGSPSNAAGAAFGGEGIYSDITGEGYYWAGGGGGSGYSTTGGDGGLGGGGGGAVNTTFGGIGYNNGEEGGGGDINSQTNRPGGNGGQHTGGGGGGGSHYNLNNKGGDGGSGVVIIRYKYTLKSSSIPIDDDYNYIPFTYDPNVENNPVLHVDSTNLLAHYKFNGNLLDSSGNNRTLSQTGAITYNTSSLNAFPYSQYIDTTATAQTNFTTTPDINQNLPISFAFWFFVSGTGSYTMMSYGDYPNPSIQFDFSGGNQLRISTELSNGGTMQPTITGLSINTWYHCVYTINSISFNRIYLNGVSSATGGVGQNQPLKNSKNLVIGESGDATRGFLGRIGDVRIYNKALNSGEVSELYNLKEQSSYSITFPENTECDILVVGGGGGGGSQNAGGGGAGGVVLIQTHQAIGTYNINVGNGGFGGLWQGLGINGFDTTFIKSDNSVIITAKGGGAGGSVYTDALNGGSGGGGRWQHANGTQTQTLQSQTGIISPSVINQFGNNGGNGGGGSASYPGGGGGGAGSVGGSNGDNTSPSNGGTGIDRVGNFIFSQKFATSVGHNGWFGGGGGTQGDSATSFGNAGFGNGGSGLLGGGGNGGSTNSFGINGTGGGGGGLRDPQSYRAGSGGSGIVIIRYKIIKEPYNAQWTYNDTNPNVYHLGNVGIGTTNPISNLQVIGSITIDGPITALSKTFKIEHPLNINKWLYHGCVEGSRFDNIYRGKKTTINGKCEIDIDKECNTTGGMIEGTFNALNTSSQLYIMNNQTYDRVNGKINCGKIKINCENTKDNIEIDWLVIGERKDEHIINVHNTNMEGKLICEHDDSL